MSGALGVIGLSGRASQFKETVLLVDWLNRREGARNIGRWHPDGFFYRVWLDTDMKKPMGY